MCAISRAWRTPRARPIRSAARSRMSTPRPPQRAEAKISCPCCPISWRRRAGSRWPRRVDGERASASLPGGEAADHARDLIGFLEGGDRQKLEARVEIIGAGEEIRRRKA